MAIVVGLVENGRVMSELCNICEEDITYLESF